MIAYLDSSVVLRSLLGQTQQFLKWQEVKEAAASEILLVECHRVLDRLRLQGELSDSDLAKAKTNLSVFMRAVTLFSVTQEVLRRAAGSFPTVIGSLDAIHLSTALVWQETLKEPVSLLTFDGQLRTAALASGLAVLP